MQDVGYWYNAQIRTLILHVQRLFSNFYISNGLKEDGTEDLRRVPCVFMSTDKSAISMINKNSDTIIESTPKMVLTISELKLNNDKISGAPYYENITCVTEKKFNEETGNYDYEPGNSFDIARLNPLPIGVTFKLFILTTMQTHKFQLFEQIRMLFSPTLELQTSENPLDWTRLAAIVLTNVNYSSRGTTNLDSSQLDSMDLTFEVDTNLDAPAIIKKDTLIERIITEIGEGNLVEDTLSWGEGESMRTVHTPKNNFITVQNNNEIILSPNDDIKNWYQLLHFYGAKYNPNNDNVYVHCLINYDSDKKKSLYGPIRIDELNPTKAYWEYDQSLLPKENLKPVNAVIDPHDYNPLNENGIRYLIVEDLGSGSSQWGELKNSLGEFIKTAPSNSIIEYINGFWTVVLNPKEQPASYYVRDLSEYKYLYSYNEDYDIWYDVINKKYRQSMWRLSYN